MKISALIETLPEKEFEMAIMKDVLSTYGAYCGHCGEVHPDLDFRRLTGDIYIARCPGGHGFILMQITKASTSAVNGT